MNSVKDSLQRDDKFQRENCENQPPWKSISFACGGWLQFYLFGVARGLQARRLDSKRVTYCGCSAGALTAVGLALEGDFDEAIEFCKAECIPKAHARISGLFRLADYVGWSVDHLLSPKFSNLGNVEIAITRLPLLNAERITSFATADDMRQTLLASCAAFPFAMPVFREGRYYLDGGYSDFQPVVDEDTLTVSPFYFSDCDIKPSRYMPLWWTLLPPKNSDTIDWVYNLGYTDCLNYLDSHAIRSPTLAQPSGQSSADNLTGSPKPLHPYSARRKVNMHRFLGYDLRNISGEFLHFMMDFWLLVLLIFLWKPMALLLIYGELVCRMTIYFVTAVWLTLWETLIAPLLMLCSPLVPQQVKSYMLVRLPKRWRVASERGKGKRTSGESPSAVRLHRSWDCFTCLWSLSLLLRFFTPACSSVELRKHDRLAKLSIVYRIFRHII